MFTQNVSVDVDTGRVLHTQTGSESVVTTPCKMCGRHQVDVLCGGSDAKGIPSISKKGLCVVGVVLLPQSIKLLLASC